MLLFFLLPPRCYSGFCLSLVILFIDLFIYRSTPDNKFLNQINLYRKREEYYESPNVSICCSFLSNLSFWSHLNYIFQYITSNTFNFYIDIVSTDCFYSCISSCRLNFAQAWYRGSQEGHELVRSVDDNGSHETGGSSWNRGVAVKSVTRLLWVSPAWCVSSVLVYAKCLDATVLALRSAGSLNMVNY